MNVVPTPATKAVAQRMVRDAVTTTGPDAVIHHLPEVDPRQLPALVGLLLNTVKMHKRTGRPRMPLVLSVEQRRKGYTLYRNGVRNEFTTTAYREYQRVNQQRRRDAQRDPERALRGVAV